MALARPAAMASQALLIAHWHAGEEHVSVVDHVGDISGLGHYLVSDVIGSEDILRTCQAVLRRSHQRHIRGNVGWFIGPFHPTVPHQLGCLTIRHPPLFVAPVRVDEPPLRNRVFHRAAMIQASLKRGPVGIPYRRFAAWLQPPHAKHACRTRAHPRCRSALWPRWRRTSFWRVVRRPSGCARSPTRVRSAAPTAPAAERGSVCFAVGAHGLRVCSYCCAGVTTLRGLSRRIDAR